MIPTTTIPCSIRVLDAGVEFVEQPFLKPLQISSGTITRITEARASVRVEADGQIAEGRGSIYLSDLWAWPDASQTHDARDAILREFCQRVATNLSEWCGDTAHPLELGMRLHDRSSGHRVIPALATAMCASPFDAAIHDAAGRALGVSAFSFYEGDCPAPSADNLFADGSAVRAVRKLLRRPPASRVAGWYLVSATDDLGETISRWAARGYTCFKIKVLARDPSEDAARTSAVYRRVLECGVRNPQLSLDSNEGNPDAQSVKDYLLALRGKDPEAYEALNYLEQPTGRDITRHAFDWRDVTGLKPVLLDEGLTDLHLLPLALTQGWSGLALKTCKGHSFALCAAAWAHENGMLLSMQDLTNPGLSAIHACLFATHIPTINGLELNSPQYTPDANRDWLPRLSGLFDPQDGCHGLPDMSPIGLGSSL